MQLVPTEHPSAVPERKPSKKKRIPRKIGEVVRLLVTGECSTVRAAAKRVGMHENYVYGALKKPEILAHLERQTRISLSMAQGPAASTLVRLLHDAQSEHVQKDVAIHLLNIAGHKPASDPQVSVNIELKAGYVIDLSEQSAPVVDVTPNPVLTHD